MNILPRIHVKPGRGRAGTEGLGFIAGASRQQSTSMVSCRKSCASSLSGHPAPKRAEVFSPYRLQLRGETWLHVLSVCRASLLVRLCSDVGTSPRLPQRSHHGHPERKVQFSSSRIRESSNLVRMGFPMGDCSCIKVGSFFPKMSASPAQSHLKKWDTYVSA